MANSAVPSCQLSVGLTAVNEGHSWSPKEGRWEEGWCRIEERKATAKLWRTKDPVLLQTMEWKKQQPHHTLWSYPRYLRTHCFSITVDIRLNFCYFPTRHYLVLSLSITCRGPHRWLARISIWDMTLVCFGNRFFNLNQVRVTSYTQVFYLLRWLHQIQEFHELSVTSPISANNFFTTAVILHLQPRASFGGA